MNQKIINKLVRLLEKLALAIKRAGMETEKKQMYACTCFFEEALFQADLKSKLELIKKSIALLESFDIIRDDSIQQTNDHQT